MLGQKKKKLSFKKKKKFHFEATFCSWSSITNMPFTTIPQNPWLKP